MYRPSHFREDRLEIQHELIRQRPLGLLISTGPEGHCANLVPFLVEENGAFGVLKAHVARANSQWQHLHGQAVLVVFRGVDSYVTPSWYETKNETGKVVPTWNYVMVQARGTARVVDDPEWLAAQIKALTAHLEAGRAAPWSVTDAPAEFIQSQIKGIIGIEIAIAAIEGKWKVSQNRSEADRRAVANALEAEGDTSAMADLIRTYGGLKS
jgi:transcriptional regulator